MQLSQHRGALGREPGRAVRLDGEGIVVVVVVTRRSSDPGLTHHPLTVADRIKRYREFKDFNKRICVATDVFGRGIDIERINLAINYDLPPDADSYLHRVGRAGRFGTKGLSISFVSSEGDQEVLKSIEKRFEVALPYVLLSGSMLYSHSPFNLHPSHPLHPQSSNLLLPVHVTLATNPRTFSSSREFPEEGIDSATYMAN